LFEAFQVKCRTYFCIIRATPTHLIILD
jgi:hypothetical protein